MHIKNNIKYWRALLVAAVLAGIAYASWPLAYVLNRPLANGLASDLEGLHQPFNWVFISGDISSSLIVIGIAALLAKNLPRSRDLLIIFSSYALFGIGTIVDAALPLHCESTIQSCPNFTHDPLLFAHGVASIASSIFLFIGVFYLWRGIRTSILLKLTLFGYALFALFSLIDSLIDSKSALSQHFYITLCSICIVILPWSIRYFPLPKSKSQEMSVSKFGGQEAD